MSEDMRWYVVNVFSGSEERAKINLMDQAKQSGSSIKLVRFTYLKRKN